MLTGGLGTRLRPHTLTRPKALLKVANAPVLDYILAKLLECQQIVADLEFIFVTGYLGEQIVEYMQQNYVQTKRLRAQFVTQAQPLGQAHAVGLTEQAVFADSKADTDLLVVFADTIFDLDWQVLTKLPEEVAGALFYQNVPDPSRFGVLLLDEKTKLVNKVVEKPATPISNKAICSPYYFKSAQLLFGAIRQIIAQHQQTKGEYYIADALNVLFEQGARMLPVEMPVWLDTGTVEAMLDTNRILLEKRHSPTIRTQDTAVIIEPVQIGSGAVIEQSVVGPYVAIGSNAVIRASVVSDSIIEENAQLDCAALKHAIVGRFAKIRGPYAEENANIGDYTELG